MGGHQVVGNITCFLHLDDYFANFSSILFISTPLRLMIDLNTK